ncbi:pirin [Salmonella enterica]|nr:pirin [Salmonella enterica]EAY0050945.1 pirin [Salmonella enterica]EAY0064288.1 pirin [Salmonella enterica]EBQ7935497.1 pirin [Salmonella enterica]
MGTPPDVAFDVARRYAVQAVKEAKAKTSRPVDSILKTQNISLSNEITIEQESVAEAPKSRRKTKQEITASKVNQALEIQDESAQDAAEVGFIARLLIQATMPHSKPEGSEWSRTNGNLSMHMMAPSAIGLPYGSYARLLLVWITTQAARNKIKADKGWITYEEARRLELGDSLSGFMSDLGLVPTGGKKGTIGILRDQMNRLFSTAITATITESHSDTGLVVDRLGGAMVADEAELWWDTRRPEQSSLWRSYVELSPKFYRLITEKPVPLDMRVLRLIKKSPMALDVYCWATYRVSYLKRATVIPWDGLMAQIGASYPNTAQGRAHFRSKFKQGLAKVKAAWPQLDATPTEKGLLLKRCAPQVSRQGRREIAPPNE